MNSLLPFLALAVVAALAAAVYLRRVRRFRQTDADRLAAWGRRPDREPDLGLISSYHFGRIRQTGESRVVDGRTWADLDLDAVFAFLDRTESAPGRQVLYDRLRSTVHSPASLAAFDDLAEGFRRDERFRLRAQKALGPLGATSVYWLWTLALEDIQPLPRWAVVYPAFAIVMLVSLFLIPVVPQLLVAPVVGLVVGSALRAKLGPRLMPLADSFRDMARLLVVADRFVHASELPDSWRRALEPRLAALARLRRLGASLGRADAAATGDLVGLLVEYLNLLFCLDANAVMLGVRELRRRQDDLHAVFAAVGSLDAALAVASARDGGAQWTRPVFAAAAAPLAFDGLRHPLLEHPVPNSLALGPPAGLLVTGANMTGKSTFLRTVGVTVVMAQTIHTVFADAYSAPWLSVASCITAGDDLQAGKSSYQAEVETLVAMLRRLDEGGGDYLFLFDELFRGTNTIDRIGAASAVLGWLVERPGGTAVSPVGAPRVPPAGAPRCLVIAATHDLELVSLLAGRLEPVHFADRLGDSGLEFDYTLRPGPTTTRNAIALLGVLGAPPEVVREALARSDALRARQ